MSTGALLGDRCLPSQAEAVDGFFSGKDPSFTSGSTSYLSWFEKVGSVWQIKRQSIASDGTTTTLTASTATVPVFPVCDPGAGFSKGMELGSLIAVPVIIVYVIRRVGWAV